MRWGTEKKYSKVPYMVDWENILHERLFKMILRMTIDKCNLKTSENYVENVRHIRCFFKLSNSAHTQLLQFCKFLLSYTYFIQHFVEIWLNLIQIDCFCSACQFSMQFVAELINEHTRHDCQCHPYFGKRTGIFLPYRYWGSRIWSMG